MRGKGTLRGGDLSGYIERHGARAAPREAARVPDGTLGGVRTVDSVSRAKLEREAASTGLLAVLTCWVPFFSVLTLVGGANRWMEARRAYGGNNGAFATVFSGVVLVAWIVVFAVAGSG